MAKIGFIGLGIMGGPMAGHLIDAGHELHLYNLPAIPPALAARGQVRSSGKDVAEHADIVIVMVPDTPDVETVLFAKDGVAEGLSRGKLVVDMSSISPVATKVFARRIRASTAITSMRRCPVAKLARKAPHCRSCAADRQLLSNG